MTTLARTKVSVAGVGLFANRHRQLQFAYATSPEAKIRADSAEAVANQAVQIVKGRLPRAIDRNIALGVIAELATSLTEAPRFITSKARNFGYEMVLATAIGHSLSNHLTRFNGARASLAEHIAAFTSTYAMHGQVNKVSAQFYGAAAEVDTSLEVTPAKYTAA